MIVQLLSIYIIVSAVALNYIWFAPLISQSTNVAELGMFHEPRDFIFGQKLGFLETLRKH